MIKKVDENSFVYEAEKIVDKLLKKGDVFTIQGEYKKRTFWQWLKKNEKELMKWEVV